jgi:hypothetical protein
VNSSFLEINCGTTALRVGDALVAIRFVIRTDEILFKSSFSAKLVKDSTPPQQILDDEL